MEQEYTDIWYVYAEHSSAAAASRGEGMIYESASVRWVLGNEEERDKKADLHHIHHANSAHS